MHFIAGADAAKRSHKAIIMDIEGTAVQKFFELSTLWHS